MKDVKEINKELTKKYKKTIWRPFVKGINKYELIQENDKIAVCISGGKDSFLMAKCFQELKKHNKINFDIIFLVMNPGYSKKNLENIKKLGEHLQIPLTIFNSNIFDVVNNETSGSPCYLCARMRRGYLYNEAKKLGCNKIALGHHFDDVIETILLNLFYGSEIKTMMPKLKSTNFKGMELIRPLYMVKEKDIINWAKNNELKFLNCACKFTEDVNINKEQESKRKEIKELITNLRNTNKNIDNSIFKALENVNLNTVIAYKKNKKTINFLNKY